MLVFRVDNRSHQTREQKPAQSTLNDGQKGYRGRKRMGRDAECRKGRLEAAILREFVDKKPGPRQIELLPVQILVIEAVFLQPLARWLQGL